MAFDWRKVFYPVAGDLFAPHLHMKQLADTTGGIVPAVNQADRDAIYAAAVAAGVDPAATPVVVDRLDTGRLERNAGTGWVVIAWSDYATGVPTLSTGWVTLVGDAYAPRLTVQGGRVDLEGAVQRSGTTGALTDILTIPAAFRPSLAVTHFVGSSVTSAGRVVDLVVTNTGTLSLASNYWPASPAADSGFVLPIRASWYR